MSEPTPLTEADIGAIHDAAERVRAAIAGLPDDTPLMQTTETDQPWGGTEPGERESGATVGDIRRLLPSPVSPSPAVGPMQPQDQQQNRLAETENDQPQKPGLKQEGGFRAFIGRHYGGSENYNSEPTSTINAVRAAYIAGFRDGLCEVLP